MRNEAHMNYLRRKTADVAELWAADRIEQLEADTKEVNAARIYLREKEWLLRDLAASQAREKVLREALEKIAREQVVLTTTLHLAQKALAAPTDDSALQAAILAEREACAVVCEKSDRYRGDYFAAKIRARGDNK